MTQNICLRQSHHKAKQCWINLLILTPQIIITKLIRFQKMIRYNNKIILNNISRTNFHKKNKRGRRIISSKINKVMLTVNRLSSDCLDTLSSTWTLPLVHKRRVFVEPCSACLVKLFVVWVWWVKPVGCRANVVTFSLPVMCSYPNLVSSCKTTKMNYGHVVIRTWPNPDCVHWQVLILPCTMAKF